jgi:hypothetical protein
VWFVGYGVKKEKRIGIAPIWRDCPLGLLRPSTSYRCTIIIRAAALWKMLPDL